MTPSQLGQSTVSLAAFEQLNKRYEDALVEIIELREAVKGEEYLHGCTRGSLADVEAQRDRLREAVRAHYSAYMAGDDLAPTLNALAAVAGLSQQGER